MSKGDGKNPKFRILCKRCNSYQHTIMEGWKYKILITCNKCGNTAESFEEEQ